MFFKISSQKLEKKHKLVQFLRMPLLPVKNQSNGRRPCLENKTFSIKILEESTAR